MATIINTRTTRTHADNTDAFTLTNAGDIFINRALIRTSGGSADGIYGNAAGLRITNESVIQVAGSGAAAIHVDGNRATIFNSGKIAATGRGSLSPQSGIVVAGDNATISNAGAILVTKVNSDAIFVTGDSARIVNTSLIRANGYYDSTAIRLEGNDASVSNAADGRIFVGVGGVAMSATGTDNVLRNDGLIYFGDVAPERQDVGSGMAMRGRGSLINDGIIDLSDKGGRALAAQGRVSIDNDGKILGTHGFQIGILGGIDHASITNAGSISLSGEQSYGIYCFQLEDARIDNSGTLFARGEGSGGVLFVGADNLVDNSGTIAGGSRGILMLGEFNTIDNGGTITVSQDDGIGIEVHSTNVVTEEGQTGGPNIIDNQGTISAPINAIVGDAGEQIVRNGGRIIGSVDLGDGDDMFVAREGSLLNGLLTLGDGDDRFVIEKTSRPVTITDFTAGGDDDEIDLTAFTTIQSFDQVFAHTSQSGDDTILQLGNGTSVVLQGVERGTLTASDFILAEPGTRMQVTHHDLVL